MTRAYILLVLKPGMHAEATDRIGKVDGVKELVLLTGKYDVIVEIDVPTVGDVLAILKSAFTDMKEVEEMETLIELPPD